MIFKATVPNTYGQMTTSRRVVVKPAPLLGHSGECDCGRPARLSGPCARCSSLDGSTKIPSLIISSLRNRVEASVAELAEELRTQPETVQRVCRRMMREGRLDRYLREFAGELRLVEVPAGKRAAYVRTSVDAGTCWSYYLVSR